jgi:rhodanese-related sulfurtransferase
LIKLYLEDNNPLYIQDSKVKITKIEDIANWTNEDKKTIDTSNNFYETNKNIDLKIANSELSEIINNKNKDYIILDARENLEYNIWNIPNSTHIRFADLKSGRWLDLPNDKFIYVVCWSWMRWKEVAEYLKSKNLVVRYLEKWVDWWVKFWWNWTWEVTFSKIYNSENYKIVFETTQVKQKEKEWVLLIDSRQPSKFKTSTVKWSINIPIMYTPTSQIDEVFSQVKKWDSIIVICDDYINCFDAKLTWIELEKRWLNFLWRYNKPWEY